MKEELQQKIKQTKDLRTATDKERKKLLPDLKTAILKIVETYWADDVALVEKDNTLRQLIQEYESTLTSYKQLEKDMKNNDSKLLKLTRDDMDTHIQGLQGPRGECGPIGLVGYNPRKPMTRAQMVKDEEKRLLRDITINRILGELIQFVSNEDYIGERLEAKTYVSEIR